jgi:hypothetical protein
MNRTMNWLLSAILLFSSFGFAVAQEQVYIKSPLTVEPGTSKTNIYFTLSLDGEERFVGYQMDIVLPEGLSMEYTKAGKPRITLVKPGVLPSYPDYNDDGEEVDVYTHSLNFGEVGDAVRVIVYSSDSDESLRYFTKKSGDLLRVYVRPTAYLKPGDVEIALRNVTFSKIDATGTTQPSVALTGVTAAATSTVSVKVSATHKYSTLVLPFDVASIPDGLTVYSCNYTNGENLVLTPQSRIKAYTPYILYAPNGFDATWSGAVDATKYSAVVTDGYLTGAVTTQEVTGGAGHYVLQNKGDGPMFYKVGDSSTFSIQPGKCWLTLPEGVQSATAFRFGTTTAVEQLKVSNENAAIYDLSGRRQNDMNQRGIYIVNGQKVIK